MAFDLLTKKQSSRDWSLGASFTTTMSDVEDRLRTLTSDTNNLNADITQHWFPKHKNEETAKRFVAQWIEWRDKTYAFIKSWNEGFRFKLAWNFMDNADQRVAELNEWRARWERLSGETAIAPMTAPKKKDESSGGWWKWLAVGLGGAVAAVFVTKKLGA